MGNITIADFLIFRFDTVQNAPPITIISQCVCYTNELLIYVTVSLPTDSIRWVFWKKQLIVSSLLVKVTQCGIILGSNYTTANWGTVTALESLPLQWIKHGQGSSIWQENKLLQICVCLINLLNKNSQTAVTQVTQTPEVQLKLRLWTASVCNVRKTPAVSQLCVVLEDAREFVSIG